ncbi:hypothetical protein FACS189427_04800 [Planctomycetales bacterium]|nr:hypothetical protein FACS189427_04800 [Planctomycetales bacterium]
MPDNPIDVKLIEQVINRLLPGLQMFARDVNLSKEIAAKYETGLIIREKGFTDATSRIGGMTTTHRFGIMSNHFANFSELDQGCNRGLSVAPAGSHFLVIGQHVHNNKTLILLLHLPNDETWQLCQHFTGNLINELINTSIERFKEKCELAPIPELANADWLDRCQIPLGMDDSSNLFETDPQGVYRYENIEDIDELPDVMQKTIHIQNSILKSIQFQEEQRENERQTDKQQEPKIDESIPLEKVHAWLTELGYDADLPLPQFKDAAWTVLRSLQKQHVPSEKQLAFLQSLGYEGEPPKTMFDAVLLIEALTEMRKENRRKPSSEEMKGKPVTERQQEYLDKLGYKDVTGIEDRAEASKIIAALEDGADPYYLDSYFRFGRKKGQWFEQEEDRDQPGTVRYIFSADELNKTRKRINKALAKVEKSISLSGRKRFEGNWSAYSGDWEPLYKSLKHLKMKQGFTLGAYIMADIGGSNGVIFGVPINTDYSDVEVVRTEYSKQRMKVPPFVFGPIYGNSDDPWGCPKLPEESVPSYMSLFIGNGKPESYLEAAVLVHKLGDFGASWHGVVWGDISIYGPDDYTKEEEYDGKKYKRFDSFANSELVKPFANPTVIFQKQQVIVRFLAFNEHIPNRFYFARHIFERNEQRTMDLQYDEDIIAIGNGGIIH